MGLSLLITFRFDLNLVKRNKNYFLFAIPGIESCIVNLPSFTVFIHELLIKNEEPPCYFRRNEANVNFILLLAGILTVKSVSVPLM